MIFHCWNCNALVFARNGNDKRITLSRVFLISKRKFETKRNILNQITFGIFFSVDMPTVYRLLGASYTYFVAFIDTAPACADSWLTAGNMNIDVRTFVWLIPLSSMLPHAIANRTSVCVCAKSFYARTDVRQQDISVIPNFVLKDQNER